MQQFKLEKAISCREFIRGSAVWGASATALVGFAPARALGANDRIRVGILSTGQRAQYIGKIFARQPSVEIVAVCDVYGPRRQEGMKLATPGAAIMDDYRAVLEREDVDAVIIGTPDHWHKQMLIDSVRAGKDAHCEKPVIHSIDEGPEMVKAVKETGRIVQTGTQQRSWAHYQLGKRLVDSGKLGKITFIHTYWCQNYYSRKGGTNSSRLTGHNWNVRNPWGTFPIRPFPPKNSSGGDSIGTSEEKSSRTS